MIIGVDLDNTILGFDRLFYSLALERGVIGPDTPCDKGVVREMVRSSPGGEEAWRELQGLAYGPRLGEARVFPGAFEFFRKCREKGVEAHIVSHKTRFAASDPTGTDMRLAAMAFLERRGFFDPDRIGFDRDRVHFESAREWKTARIARLGCEIFIDDLVEVFEDPGFPAGTRKMLFRPGIAPGPGYEVVASWSEVMDAVFPEG